MIKGLYQFLETIGYHHPLHPALTHLPVGLVMAALIFALLGLAMQKSNLSQSSRHCLFLAIVALPATAILGYFDWKLRLGGAMLFPIKMKLVLAPILFFLLIVAAFTGRGEMVKSIKNTTVMTLALLVVIAIGFFGGELVFAPGASLSPQKAAAVDQTMEGAALFQQKCSMCHLSDSAATKIGPGLKGLYHLGKLPTSGRPVSDEAIGQQLRSPYRDMPAFPDLSDQEVRALADYLKTL